MFLVRSAGQICVEKYSTFAVFVVHLRTMTKVFTAIISLLIFCFYSLAQTEESSPCPQLLIHGPMGIVSAGDSITFLANIDKDPNNSKLKFEWTVKEAEIIEGQGTNMITVQPKNGFEMNITATVIVSGLSKNCGTLTASETRGVDRNPESRKVIEFLYSDSELDNSLLDDFAQELKDDPSAISYTLIGFETDSDRTKLSKKTEEIRNYLTKNQHVAPDRLVFLNVGKTKNLIQLWIVPAGASPPTP